MLAKINRLPASVRLTKSNTLRSPYYFIKYSFNNLTYSRFGFIVRKSVDKRATVRNRARRVVRSCIEQSLESIVPGLDMLFLLEKGIIEKNKKK